MMRDQGCLVQMSQSDSRMPPLLRDLYLIMTISWIFYSPYCLESLFYFYSCRIEGELFEFGIQYRRDDRRDESEIGKGSVGPAGEEVVVGLLEVLLGVLWHVFEDDGGLGEEVLSDEVGECEFDGVVDLFLRSADEDEVERPGHLRLEGLGGGEVGKEFGEDDEDVSGGREECEVSGEIDCYLHGNAVPQHFQQRPNDSVKDTGGHCLDLINRIPPQVKLLELGRHLACQLPHILLQQLIGLLIPDEIEVEIDDQRQLKIEHLQNGIDELGAPPEDLTHVLFGSVIFEDFDGQKAPDYAVAQVLAILELQQLSHEGEADLGVLVDFSDLLDDAQDGLKVAGVPEHCDEDVFQVLFEEVFGLLRRLVLPFDYFVPDGPAELHHLDDEVQNGLGFAGHHEGHRLQLVFGLALGDLEGQLVVLLPVLNDLEEGCQGFVEVDSDEGFEVGRVGVFGEVIGEDGEQIFEVLELIGLFVESTDEYEYGLLDDWQGEDIPGNNFHIPILQLHVSQLGDHLFLNAGIHVPFLVVVLQVQHRPVAIHHLLNAVQQVDALEDLPVEIHLCIFFEIFLHVDKQEQILLRELMILEYIGRSHIAQPRPISGGSGQADIEDPFLHEFQHVFSLVVLIERFDDQVDPYWVVKDIVAGD